MHLGGKWLCLRKEQKVMFELKTINIMYAGCVFQNFKILMVFRTVGTCSF